MDLYLVSMIIAEKNSNRQTQIAEETVNKIFF